MILPRNPFAETYAPEPSDEHLVNNGTGGDTEAVEELVKRHQRWIYNLALRVLQSPEDAADATQEALLKIVTRLATFRGEATFRTWAYRIALRHILARKSSRPEQTVNGFGCFGSYLTHSPDEDLTLDDETRLPDTKVLVEEAKLSCLLGMLLCLDREQRIVFVLGEIFEVTDVIGSEILETTRDAFRQKLARARRDLQSFMREQCGLVEPRNPCRCVRKTRAFIRDGIVDPERLVFYSAHAMRVRDVCGDHAATVDVLVDEAHRVLFREQPFYEAPDIVARVRELLANDVVQQVFEIG